MPTTYSNSLYIGAICFALFGVTACSSNQKIPFEVLTQSNQCYQQEAKITPLKTPQAQANFLTRFSAFKPSEEKNELSANFKAHAQTQTLFMISLGSKPSAGYGFNILSNSGILENQTLSLPIVITKPASDSFSAQVITTPCIVIGIESKVHYQELIIDSLKLKLSDN